MAEILEYFKNRLPLVIVLGVILVMILVLIVTLIVELAKRKKQRKAQDGQPAEAPAAQPAQEKPAEQPAPAAQPAPVVVEAPKEESVHVEEIEDEQEDEEEKRPASAPAKKAKKPFVMPSKPFGTIVKPISSPTTKTAGAIGKWVVYEEDRGGYGFRLHASNGEVMLTSSSPYASPSSAKSGIKTYQDAVAAGRMAIVETKSGSFFVQISNASNRLLATSADYKTRSSCENAAESIKRWAPTTIIVVEKEESDKK